MARSRHLRYFSHINTSSRRYLISRLPLQLGVGGLGIIDHFSDSDIPVRALFVIQKRVKIALLRGLCDHATDILPPSVLQLKFDSSRRMTLVS